MSEPKDIPVLVLLDKRDKQALIRVVEKEGISSSAAMRRAWRAWNGDKRERA